MFLGVRSRVPPKRTTRRIRPSDIILATAAPLFLERVMLFTIFLRPDVQQFFDRYDNVFRLACRKPD